MENIKETVIKTAELSKLKFSDKEINEFTSQFEKILDYVAQIDKLDLSDIRPLTHILEIVNVEAEDIAQEAINIKDALKNAPKHNDNFFKVPKVIDQES